MLSGGSTAPPTLASLDWLFGLSTAVIFFSVSVLFSKSDVLFMVNLDFIQTKHYNKSRWIGNNLSYQELDTVNSLNAIHVIDRFVNVQRIMCIFSNSLQ